MLLLIVLAAAVLWTTGPGIRAAAIDRAEKSATPATTAAAEPQSGKGQAKGKVTRDQVFPEKFQKVAPSEQTAASMRAAKAGMQPGVAGRAGGIDALDARVPPPDGIEGPGGVPHYFGPYGNLAFSPLPQGAVTEVTIVGGGLGYTNPAVTITDAYGTATVPATVTATVAGGVITGFTVSDGANYSAPVVTIEDLTGTGAVADAAIGGTLTGGLPKFVDPVQQIPFGLTSSRTRSRRPWSGRWPTGRRSGESSTTAWTRTPSTRTCSPRRSSTAWTRAASSWATRSIPSSTDGRTPSASTRWRSCSSP